MNYLSFFETLFDEQNQPWYNLDDIKRYLISAGIRIDRGDVGATKTRSELDKDSHLPNQSWVPHLIMKIPMTCFWI